MRLMLILLVALSGCGGEDPGSNDPIEAPVIGMCGELECETRAALEMVCAGGWSQQPATQKRCNDRCIPLRLTCTDPDPCLCEAKE